MCYLIAADREKQGCFALKSTIGRHLSEFIDDLNKNVRKGIQIAVISRPTAYGEYEPYTFLEDEQAFKHAVMTL